MTPLRAYAVWAVASLFVLYQFSIQVSVAIFAPQLERDLGLSVAATGALTASFALSYAVMQIPVGLLLDRFSPRWLMSVAFFFCAIGALVFATAESLPVMMAGRVLMGLAAAFGFVGTGFLAGRWFPPARFALVMGLSEMVGVSGAAFADMGSAWLQAHFGWREIIAAAGWAGCGFAIVLWLVIRDRPPGFLPPAAGQGSPAEAFRELRRSPQILVAAGFYFLSMGTLLGFSGLWNVPFQLSFDLPLETVATATGLIFLGWGLGSVFGGWLSDRMGTRRPVLLASAIGQAVVMALILYTPMLPLPVIWAFRISLGFFGGMNVVAFAAAADVSSPAQRGFILGFINTMGFLGVAVLQFLPGLLLPGSGTQPTVAYEFALTTYLVALAGAALFALRIARRTTPRA